MVTPSRDSVWQHPKAALMSRRASTTAVLCLTLVVTCPTLVLTQTRFDSWTTENGPPQNSIRDILQTRDDRHGTLWAGTTDGKLIRYEFAKGQTASACAQLADFVIEVTRKVGDGALTAEEGAALLDSARSIRTSLGCS